MKNLYLLTVLCTFTCIASAQSSLQMETVGVPASPCAVNAYTGWANNGVLTFAGNAEVQTTNPSNNLSASGGGNVFFNNVVGTEMVMSGFAATTTPQSIDITFDMYGYNASNLSELALEYSTDNGATYSPLYYKRLFRDYFPPTPWDVMVSDPLPGTINFSTLKIRFRQTSSTQQFRIDDIEANFYYTLPIKLISFSASQSKGETLLQWRANSTHEQEYFTVEKSNDGRHFSPVSNVQVKGIGDHTYYFTDASVGKTFYRLKLVDVSGKYNYSQIIYVHAAATREGLLQKIYPVPAREVINTQLNSTKQENIMISMTDMSGRTVMTKRFTLMQGMNNCAINVQQLNAGMYILKIITGDVTETRPVMIQ